MKEQKHEKCGANTPPHFMSPGAVVRKETPAIRKLKEERKNLYALVGQTQLAILERQRDINKLQNRIDELNCKIKSLTK